MAPWQSIADEIQNISDSLGDIYADHARRMYASQEPFIRDGIFHYGEWREHLRAEQGIPSVSGGHLL